MTSSTGFGLRFHFWPEVVHGPKGPEVICLHRRNEGTACVVGHFDPERLVYAKGLPGLPQASLGLRQVSKTSYLAV